MAEPAWMTGNEIFQMDLNGDGVQEILSWYVEEVNEYEQMVNVAVQTQTRNVQWSMPLYGVKVLAEDLDGDGMVEIFVSGDIMSDDYVTYCLHFDGVDLVALNFADINRGTNDGTYYDYGYGRIVRVGDNTIELQGSQDFLGTYFASRILSLQDGRFEVADDGVWRITSVIDQESWEYRALLPVQDIPVTFFGEDGEEDGLLLAGEKVVITGSDKIAVVYFTTEDGRAGYFSIAPDTMNGWGSIVGGIPEAEAFEYVPYAD